jgi:hypothetical protein
VRRFILYSWRRLSAGLATAALMVWRAMLKKATTKIMRIEKANNPALSLLKYGE